MPAAHIRASNNARRITFEYVMLKGVNDSPARCARAGAAARGHPGQGQSHPVQPLAGRALRCSTEAAIGVFGDIVFRRLRLARADAARPRHPCRLRPAQIRQRQTAQKRAACRLAAALIFAAFSPSARACCMCSSDPWWPFTG